jgi:Xaa-Pro aminopeptidase
VEAKGEYTFHYHGAEDIGYPSICGSAENGCVLHYEKNRRPLSPGDLILLDMGAEYHGYTADITRTLPVSGGFTAEQRAVYDIVLRAQEAGIRACKTGNAFREPHNAAYREVAAGLLELGLITTEKQAKQYFPHSTSHYLGLDVHDPGSYGVLEANQVITVEPGIYIPPGSPCDKKWWNIGIRIEDDILITPDGPENLSGKLPRDPEVIEKLITNARSPALETK